MESTTLPSLLTFLSLCVFLFSVPIVSQNEHTDTLESLLSLDGNVKEEPHHVPDIGELLMPQGQLVQPHPNQQEETGRTPSTDSEDFRPPQKQPIQQPSNSDSSVGLPNLEDMFKDNTVDQNVLSKNNIPDSNNGDKQHYDIDDTDTHSPPINIESLGDDYNSNDQDIKGLETGPKAKTYNDGQDEEEEDDEWYDDPNDYDAEEDEDEDRYLKDGNDEDDYLDDDPEDESDRDEDYDDSEWVAGENDHTFSNYLSEQNVEGVVDEELANKNKPPTAPSSMVLFYTWMVVAVLVIVVGFSTYQARCKGMKLPGIPGFSGSKQSSGPGDDRKRLLDHEFV